MKDQATLNIFFMVEPGPLEFQAYLLLSSLSVNCLDKFRVTCFCRRELIAGLNDATLDYLGQHDATLLPLDNDFSDGYDAGNKLIACSLVTGGGWHVFLDTDMFMIRPASFTEVTKPGHVSTCIDTVNGWSKDENQWDALYGIWDLPKPSEKVTLLRGGISYPIYNAGLVMFPDALEGEAHFGQVWKETASRIDASRAIGGKRPWLDTISLPVAMDRWKAVHQIHHNWNCTTELADEHTIILHYHGVRQLIAFGWADRVSDVLTASGSSFQDLRAAARHYKDVLGVKGDMFRRALYYSRIKASAV